MDSNPQSPNQINCDQSCNGGQKSYNKKILYMGVPAPSIVPTPLPPIQHWGPMYLECFVALI